MVYAVLPGRRFNYVPEEIFWRQCPILRITDESVLVRWTGLEIAKMTRGWGSKENLLPFCWWKRILVRLPGRETPAIGYRAPGKDPSGRPAKGISA